MISGLLISGIFLDLLTLLFLWPLNLFKRDDNKRREVSIIIPAYNEEKNIAKVIEAAFDQTNKPRKVIVIDDCSSDKTYKICKRLERKYPALVAIKQKKNMGKAYNVNQILRDYNLAEITIILDADTFLSKNYIEEVIKPFSNRRVAVVTGTSLPLMHKNFMGRFIFHGSFFQYKFFSFRKVAQSWRNAVSVISGDSSAYRTEFLKEADGLPYGTATEDMDLTWIALEKGYRVAYQRKALARSYDAPSLRGHIKQIVRWYSGGFQCIFKHRARLLKARPLLFTTLLPFAIDMVVYAPLLLTALFFYPIAPKFVIGFYLADLIFSVIVLAVLDPKGLLYLPAVYFVKLLWALIWIYAGIKTSIQYVFGKESWSGRWEKDTFYSKKIIKESNAHNINIARKNERTNKTLEAIRR